MAIKKYQKSNSKTKTKKKNTSKKELKDLI